MQKNHRQKRKLTSLGKFAATFFGGFFVLCIIVISVVGSYWYFNKDDFVRLVPEKSVLYLRINKSDLFKKSDLKDLNLQKLYNHIEEKLSLKNISFEKEILPLANRQFGLALFNINDNLAYVVFLKTSDEKHKLPIFTSNQSLIDNKILVLADSQQSLDYIMETSRGSLPNLKEKLASKFFENDFLKLYLDLEQTNVAADKDSNLNKIIFNFVHQSDLNNLLLTLNKQLGHWKFNIKVVPEVESKLYSTSLKKLSSINFLPQNFIFFIKPVDLAKTISNISGLGVNNISNYQNKLEGLAKQNNFNLIQDIAPLFMQGFDLLLIDSKPNEENLNFAINFSLNDYNEDVLNLPEKLSEVFAKRYPEEVVRILPDNTEVIELIAKPQDFIFKKQNLGKSIIYYLTLPEYNIEIAYTIINNEMIVASSKEILIELVKPDVSKQLSVDFLNKQCWSAGKNSLVFINLEQVKNNLEDELSSIVEILPGDVYIISQDTSDGFSGCIF